MPPAGRMVVAVIGPGRIDQGDWSAAADSAVVVILDGLSVAGVPERGGVVPAVLACDALAVVLPATVGLDPLTAGVWQVAAAAGLPRAVVITDLDSATADFEDLAAIAERVLGAECLPVALPVFDDDGSVCGALDLVAGVMADRDGSVPVERAHLRFSAGPRLRLVSALAAVVADEAVAGRALAVVAAADPDDPEGDAVVWGDPVWSLAEPLAEAVAEGTMAPVLPETPVPAGPLATSATVQRRILGWFAQSALDATWPVQRALVRRDVHGEPCDGPAAVVLAAQGERAVVRPLHGERIVTEGLLTLTRTGSATADPTGPLVSYRAWPVGVVEHEDLGGYAMVTLTMRPAVGDVLTDRPLWLVPEE